MSDRALLRRIDRFRLVCPVPIEPPLAMPLLYGANLQEARAVTFRSFCGAKSFGTGASPSATGEYGNHRRATTRTLGAFLEVFRGAAE